MLHYTVHPVPSDDRTDLAGATEQFLLAANGGDATMKMHEFLDAIAAQGYNATRRIRRVEVLITPPIE